MFALAATLGTCLTYGLAIKLRVGGLQFVVTVKGDESTCCPDLETLTITELIRNWLVSTFTMLLLVTVTKAPPAYASPFVSLIV